MGLNLTQLAAQGRAFSASRPWTDEELAAVVTLTKERHLSMVKAADFVRNGVLTLEEFDQATKKEFVPKTLEEAQGEVETKLKEEGKKAVKATVKKKKK